MRLIDKPARRSALLRLATVGVCVVFSIVVCASTLALSVHVDALAAGQEQPPGKTAGPIAVRADIMQKQVAHKVAPIYPEDAKKAQITGKVQLEAVIGKSGEVENLKVVSGPKELQRSALDAVRQWTYKPFLLNGAAVEVKTTIDVNYSLSHP
jgi:TonB family protein